MKAFVSYSHDDEWLKKEFLDAMSAATLSEEVELWHDREIPPGGFIDDEIDENLNNSRIIFLLVSASFLASRYCMQKEYERAKELHYLGELSIIPIIVRSCDFNCNGLNKFNFLPQDAKPIDRGGDKSHKGQRDSAWTQVATSVRKEIEKLQETETILRIKPECIESRSERFGIKHPNHGVIDIVDIFIPPNLAMHYEGQEIQLNKFEEFSSFLKSAEPVILYGDDYSGKSSIFQYAQHKLVEDKIPAVIIEGKKIKNANIKKIVASEVTRQLNLKVTPEKLIVLVDDFKQCNLPAKTKDLIINSLINDFAGCHYSAFSPIDLKAHPKLLDSETIIIEVLPLNGV